MGVRGSRALVALATPLSPAACRTPAAHAYRGVRNNPATSTTGAAKEL